VRPVYSCTLQYSISNIVFILHYTECFNKSVSGGIGAYIKGRFVNKSYYYYNATSSLRDCDLQSLSKACQPYVRVVRVPRRQSCGIYIYICTILSYYINSAKYHSFIFYKHIYRIDNTMRAYAAVHHRDRGRNYISRPRKCNIFIIKKYNIYYR